MSYIKINTTPKLSIINIDNHVFHVANHWFWKQFPEWEPETFEFYERYCVQESNVLDIGAWIGPTALIALRYKAKTVTMVEPNPATIKILENSIQLDGSLRDSWNILPYCVSNKLNSIPFGMPDGNIRSSSAASTRGTGAFVNTITIEKIINTIDMAKVSLIKIDIEGSEYDIISDLVNFSRYNAPIWLSLHPPFVPNTTELASRINHLYDYFYILNAKLNNLSPSELEYMILYSKHEIPSWGTEFGNFFEIALFPKQFFDSRGNRTDTN